VVDDVLAIVCGRWRFECARYILTPPTSIHEVADSQGNELVGELMIDPDMYRYTPRIDISGARYPVHVPTPRFVIETTAPIAIHASTGYSSDGSRTVARIAFGASPGGTDQFFIRFDPHQRVARMSPDFHVMAFPFDIQRQV
jgi:hypothetical protein